MPDATLNSMVDVNSISRRYGQTTAVDDVSFSIAHNEIVGLLGHNGAGKSTVLKMLSGYLDPHSGSISIAGLPLAGNTKAIQSILGYLPENLPLYPEMFVADYLDYAATLKGITQPSRMQCVRDALAATDLVSRALDPIATLSRGLKQRVGVAQAVLGKPKLLILDEPTNGLDPQQTEHMRQLIARLSQSASIILSTHILQEVDALCSRVLMLKEGKLALDKAVSELGHSNTWILHTNSSVTDLKARLEQLPQVESVAQAVLANTNWQFTLQLESNTPTEAASNNIAQCVVASGASLYQLNHSPQNLESVFHAVNGSED